VTNTVIRIKIILGMVWKKYADSVFSGKSMILLVIGGLIAGGILALLR